MLSALGIPTRGARSHWKAVLAEIGHPEMQSFLPVNALFVQQFSRAFLRVLDTIALRQGKYVWLEKTPGHLRLVDNIERLVKNARFIHLIRNGADNIASLYEVGKKYPETWGRWYGTLDQCIQRWVIDIRISLKNYSKNMHSLIKYEDLIANPKPSLEKICRFIEVPYEEKMLTDYPTAAAQIILKIETKWKDTVSGPIKYADRRKFYDYLNEEQRKYILTQIPEELIEYVGHMGQ